MWANLNLYKSSTFSHNGRDGSNGQNALIQIVFILSMHQKKVD